MALISTPQWGGHQHAKPIFFLSITQNPYIRKIEYFFPVITQFFIQRMMTRGKRSTSLGPA